MLNFTPHQKIKLREHPTFNEIWVHDRIVENLGLLGLGTVDVIDRERVVQGGGRLDLLLYDAQNNFRYEVEVMLGKTDPSHLVRTIEYWDIERRRYPAYEHIAVLIAEDITSRFLNVISLLAGSIPLIAIQLDALVVQDHLVLNFVRVLDQTQLRTDDTPDDGADRAGVEREYWVQRASEETMSICDGLLKVINSMTSSQYELNYKRSYIGLRTNGVANNFVYFAPKATLKRVLVTFLISDPVHWKERFENEGIEVPWMHRSRVRISLTPEELKAHEKLVHEAIALAIRENEA